MVWQDEVRSLADFEAKCRRCPATLAPLRLAEPGKPIAFPKAAPRGKATLRLVDRVMD